MNKVIWVTAIFILIAGGVATYLFSGGESMGKKTTDTDNFIAVPENEMSIEKVVGTKKTAPILISSHQSLAKRGPLIGAESSPLSESELEWLTGQLEVDTSNPYVEYKYSDEGSLLMELDNDEHSASYKKPLKYYEHLNGEIVTVVRLEYLEDSVISSRLDVAYNSDGEVVNFTETEK